MKSILFVCLGNICRSPTAEAVLRKMASSQGVPLRIDSAGTIDHHKGKLPDRRAVAAAQRRGYDFTGIRSRPITSDDFHNFELILAADHYNLADLKAICPEPYQHKLGLILDFSDGDYREVPDPYYGGSRGFELVLDLIEQACSKMLEGERITQ
jgi:protein-tyrosine phosphatase